MADWIPGLLVALIGIVPGVLVWRQAAEARHESQAAQRYAQGIDARKADQEAYKVASSIYEAGLQEAQRQLAQRAEANLLLEREVGRLRKRRDQLEGALRSAGVPPPAEEGAP